MNVALVQSVIGCRETISACLTAVAEMRRGECEKSLSARRANPVRFVAGLCLYEQEGGSECEDVVVLVAKSSR